MSPMGPTMKNEFPEIKNFTRVRWATKYPLNYGDKKVFFPSIFTSTEFLVNLYPALQSGKTLGRIRFSLIYQGCARRQRAEHASMSLVLK